MEKVSFIAAFFAGLLSFLSPCILPLIPGYISFISGASIEELTGQKIEVRRQKTETKIILNILLFIFGFSFVFIALGASATAIGGILQTRLALISKIAGVVIVVFGLHLLGLFKIKAFYSEKRFHLRTKPLGLFGSFIIGLAFAFGWTPCIGPILAGILAFAATQEKVLHGVFLLSIYSAGLGIPFLLTGIAINRFFTAYDKIKHHFRKVEIISGILLIAVGIMVFTDNLMWLMGYLP